MDSDLERMGAMGRIWTVCSGSGGVGKTTVALSLAVGAAAEGYDTILLDMSGISRSCDLVLGLESAISLDMMDVLSGQVKLEAALYSVPKRPHLRFACAALYDTIPVSEMAGVVLALHSMCDILIIDLPTGGIEAAKGMMHSGDERIIVSRPDAASVRSAERLMMRYRGDLAGISLVVNRMPKDRKSSQYTLEAVENTLDRRAIGCIPEDTSIVLGEKNGKAAIECGGAVRQAFSGMLRNLLSDIEK